MPAFGMKLSVGAVWTSGMTQSRAQRATANACKCSNHSRSEHTRSYCGGSEPVP
jgi:hypothetical protein